MSRIFIADNKTRFHDRANDSRVTLQSHAIVVRLATTQHSTQHSSSFSSLTSDQINFVPTHSAFSLLSSLTIPRIANRTEGRDSRFGSVIELRMEKYFEVNRATPKGNGGEILATFSANVENCSVETSRMVDGISKLILSRNLLDRLLPWKVPRGDASAALCIRVICSRELPSPWMFAVPKWSRMPFCFRENYAREPSVL